MHDCVTLGSICMLSIVWYDLSVWHCRSGNKCLLKVAHMCATMQDFSKAASVFEDVSWYCYYKRLSIPSFVSCFHSWVCFWMTYNVLCRNTHSHSLSLPILMIVFLLSPSLPPFLDIMYTRCAWIGCQKFIRQHSAQVCGKRVLLQGSYLPLLYESTGSPGELGIESPYYGRG